VIKNNFKDIPIVSLEVGLPKVSPRFYAAPVKIVVKGYELYDLTNIRKLFYLPKQINSFYYTSLKTLPFGKNWLAGNSKSEQDRHFR